MAEEADAGEVLDQRIEGFPIVCVRMEFLVARRWRWKEAWRASRLRAPAALGVVRMRLMLVLENKNLHCERA